EVIRGFPLTADSYRAAYKLLEERYGNQQIISDTLVAQILSLRNPGNSVGELRSFYDTIEGNLRALDARGKNIDDNSELRLIIQEKLPKGVRVDLEKSKDEDRSWTLFLLRTRLLAHIQQRECVENIIPPSGSHTDSRNQESRSSRSGSQGAPRSSAQNLAAGSFQLRQILSFSLCTQVTACVRSKSLFLYIIHCDIFGMLYVL
ncbi:MAG: DUF1759 domain-containing protein, partial [Gammaproteobacteria bacterium]|nr:DUF1759 domain-containing protein [Gammaproteobacteria bacterium]